VVTAILLDEARWAGVPDERRQEWRLAIRELIDEQLFRIEQSPVVMRVAWDDDEVRLRWEALDEGLVAAVTLGRAELDRQINDYVEICRKLSALDAEAAGLVEVAALDQAKRDAHDLAARAIVTALDVVGPTHGTARLIFTMLVVLLVDTTKLSVLQRPHGEGVISRYH
jgi:uncharacterized protein (UPF0262 family)